jgi:hypothetical protein
MKTKKYETIDDILNELENESRLNKESDIRLLKSFLKRGIKGHYVDYLKRIYPEYASIMADNNGK